MKKETRNTVKAGVKIGALAGGLIFLVLGLVPAFYLSSYGAVMALSALSGGPVAAGMVVRVVVVVASVAGICTAWAASIGAGAAAGSALGYVAEALTPKHAEEAMKSEG